MNELGGISEATLSDVFGEESICQHCGKEGIKAEHHQKEATVCQSCRFTNHKEKQYDDTMLQFEHMKSTRRARRATNKQRKKHVKAKKEKEIIPEEL